MMPCLDKTLRAQVSVAGHRVYSDSSRVKRCLDGRKKNGTRVGSDKIDETVVAVW